VDIFDQIRARRLEVAMSSISHSSSTLAVTTSAEGVVAMLDDEADAPELERLLEDIFVDDCGCTEEA
jgi:hypothetical protein